MIAITAKNTTPPITPPAIAPALTWEPGGEEVVAADSVLAVFDGPVLVGNTEELLGYWSPG